MKRTYIIIALALLSWLVFTSQECLFTKKTNSESTIDTPAIPKIITNNQEESYLPEILELEEIGGADYSFIESLNYFKTNNFPLAAQMLSTSSEYLQGDGEDLDDIDVNHLLSTVSHIESLVIDLENTTEENRQPLQNAFSKIGMNMVKDYVAIAISMDESPEDNEFYVSKAITILNSLIEILDTSQQSTAEKLMRDLNNYDQMVIQGKSGTKSNLKKLHQEIYQMLVNQKIYFS